MTASADPRVVKILVVALCVTVSVVAALVSGILARADGASLASAVNRGGAAFTGALALALAVAGTFGGLS